MSPDPVLDSAPMSAHAEIRRLKYLTAMGVTPLVSRRALAGAGPSHKLALRVPVTAPTTPEAPAPSHPQAPLAREMLASFRGDSTRQDLPQRKPSADGKSVEPGTQKTALKPAQSVNRFRLVAIISAQRLWLEDLGEDALATEQLQLVASIARALSHSDERSKTPLVTQFDWPLHGNEQLDLGADEAAATLTSFLQRQLDDHACVELMCLGPAAAQRVSGLALPCAQRRLPGTRELLDAPLRKRDLWRELRS